MKAKKLKKVKGRGYRNEKTKNDQKFRAIYTFRALPPPSPSKI